MANLSTLPDLIPWPFLICSRAGVVLFANPLVNRTLGRPIQVGTDINDLFMELDNGRAVSTLLYAAARWSAWSGMLELRNNRHCETRSISSLPMMPWSMACRS